MRLIFTDLDGTFLDKKSQISSVNRLALSKLEEAGFVIVAATGRNLYSCNKVLSNDLPIDYLIFSTGVGILDFKTKKIFDSNYFDDDLAKKIVDLLSFYELNFFAHKKIPNNHLFLYKKYNSNEDFDSRFEIYRDFGEPVGEGDVKNISQFVVVLSNEKKEFLHFEKKIMQEVKNVNIIRATSPLNHKNIWLEIYPNKVSKGRAAVKLTEYIGADLQDTYAVGNDFNDVEMLDFAEHAFVVQNSPLALLKKYKNLKSNDDDGFAQMVDIILQK